MIAKVISLYPLNEELNIQKWGARLLKKDKTLGSPLSIRDRSIPKSRYEKVSLKDDDSGTKYRILEIDSKYEYVVLDEYGKVHITEIYSDKPEIEEGFYNVKLLFIYDTKYAGKIYTYSSKSFIEEHGYYEELKTNKEGDRFKVPIRKKDITSTRIYVELISKADSTTVEELLGNFAVK